MKRNFNLVALSIAMAFAGSAQANPITYAIEGAFDPVEFEPLLSGTSYKATLTFDPSTLVASWRPDWRNALFIRQFFV